MLRTSLSDGRLSIPVAMVSRRTWIGCSTVEWASDRNVGLGEKESVSGRQAIECYKAMSGWKDSVPCHIT